MDRKPKKAKTWLHRLLTLRLNDEDTEIYLRRYDSPSFHRSSFRRSLKKMHSRVKSCMFPQEVAMKRPITITEIPCSSASPQVRESTPHRIPTDEIHSLANCYWYWGPMPTSEAEEKLQFKPDGAFLVRDSSSTSYLFSISFRSLGKTMHARIEYSRGRYNLCGTYSDGFSTVTELIQDAMKTSEKGIYCYSRKGDQTCEFPVRLTKPISRYTEVRPLKYLCKFVIRQYTNINDIQKLPLPTALHNYLLEKPYF